MQQMDSLLLTPEVSVPNSHLVKWCCVCNKTKDISKFNKNKSRPDGLSVRCKKCRQTLEKRSKLNMKKAQLKHCYGISLDEYLKMLQFQKNKCAICGIDASQHTTLLAVDHDHSTNHIRGLLCTRCNRLLGKYEAGQLKTVTLLYSKIRLYYLCEGVDYPWR